MPHAFRPEKHDGVSRALAVALAWMFAVQLACVLFWDAGWLTRTSALMHWLAIGVLPPALALWTSGPSQRTDGAQG